MNITGPYWWLVGNGSSICLVSSGNTSLPEPILTQTYITIWCNKATMSLRITQWREIRTLRVKCNSTITPLTSHTCHGVLIGDSNDCLTAYLGRINNEKLKAALFTLCEGKPAVTCGFHSQKTSNAASCSILWRHRAYSQIYHYRDVIIGAMASQINQPHDCLLNRSFWRRSKKTSKFCVTGLCGGNSPVTGELPAQMASNAKNVPFDDVIMHKWDLIKTLSIFVSDGNYLWLHRTVPYPPRLPHYTWQTPSSVTHVNSDNRRTVYRKGDIAKDCIIVLWAKVNQMTSHEGGDGFSNYR